jgi:hypothetical protein
MSQHQIRVNLVALMLQAAEDCKSPGITVGFQVAISSLQRLATRACELGDKAILDELVLLNLVEAAE